MQFKVLLFVACFAAGPTVNATEFEMKGLHIGMSEAQFKAINPRASCDKAYRDPLLDTVSPAIPLLRTCSVPEYTVAAQKAKSTQFIFYGDQLGHMLHTFHADDSYALQAAFVEKYGKPTVDAARNTVEWSFSKTTSLKLRREPGDTVYLFLDSKPSLDYLMQKKAIERLKAQKDL